MNRLTDSKVVGVPHSTVRYATIPAANLDGSLALVDEVRNFALYDLRTRTRISPLSWLGDSNEPLWSKNESGVFYYHTPTRLMRYNVAADERSPIYPHDFGSITFKGEGDIQAGKIACLVDNRFVHLFDLANRSMSCALDIGGHSCDAMYPTPDGGCLISWGVPGLGDGYGIDLYDHDMRHIRKLTALAGHKDVMLDPDGVPHLIITSNIDNAIWKYPLSGETPTMILSPLDWGLIVNISCPDRADYCIVSVYGEPINRGASYAGSILKVPLKFGDLVRVLAPTGTTARDYTRQPKASISGKLVLWNSDSGNASGPVDVFMTTILDEPIGDGWPPRTLPPGSPLNEPHKVGDPIPVPFPHKRKSWWQRFTRWFR